MIVQNDKNYFLTTNFLSKNTHTNICWEGRVEKVMDLEKDTFFNRLNVKNKLTTLIIQQYNWFKLHT